ncbi:thioredoxin fold domain-containing protein [Candidatus Woesearchaeota archaeon]|nr:thioredoxin fold domain-containing protein [Candidatus Woesearchaeota archaeon]
MEISDKEFNEVITSKEPVLVMFWGSWCPVCKRSEVLLREIAEDINYEIKKMNIDRNPRATAKCNILGSPTFILFKEGKEIKRAIGAQSKNQILAMFEND